MTSARAAAPVALTGWHALGKAWGLVTGTVGALAEHTKAGWTPPDVFRLGEIASAAVEARTALADVQGGETVGVARELGEAAIVFSRRLTLSPQVALPWLTMLAGHPEGDPPFTGQLLVHANARGFGVKPDELCALLAWDSGLGEIGPLGYAAGLSLDEACARLAGGTLDESGLRTLAALRGYRLLAPRVEADR